MLVCPGLGRLVVRDGMAVLGVFGGCFGAPALVWAGSGIEVWWLGLGVWVERLAGLAWAPFRSRA